MPRCPIFENPVLCLAIGSLFQNKDPYIVKFAHYCMLLPLAVVLFFCYPIFVVVNIYNSKFLIL